MSRPVRLVECQRCSAPILTGVDDFALDVLADPIPLTRMGEIWAMASGRTCWRIDYERRAWRTDRFRIRSDCPFPGDHRVSSHVCGVPPPSAWLAPIPDAIVITHQPDPNGEPEW